MRDLSNQEKQEVQRLTKVNEKFTAEITNLKKDKERFAGEVEQLSQQMIDLKEQVRISNLLNHFKMSGDQIDFHCDSRWLTWNLLELKLDKMINSNKHDSPKEILLSGAGLSIYW